LVPKKNPKIQKCAKKEVNKSTNLQFFKIILNPQVCQIKTSSFKLKYYLILSISLITFALPYPPLQKPQNTHQNNHATKQSLNQ
jgi:hypothetical protein